MVLAVALLAFWLCCTWCFFFFLEPMGSYCNAQFNWMKFACASVSPISCRHPVSQYSTASGSTTSLSCLSAPGAMLCCAVVVQLMSNLDFPVAVKELGEAVSYLKGSGATKVGGRRQWYTSLSSIVYRLQF